MRKLFFTFILLIFISCSKDCDVDNQEIARLSLEIGVLDSEVSETTSEESKEILKGQLAVIKDQLYKAANACD